MAITLDEIRRVGLEALRERLGGAGMVRFLQQFETGHGDYVRERTAWAELKSLDDLRGDLSKLRAGKRREAKA